MRVSYEWLKDMVALPDDPQDLAAALSRTGTEVEGIEKMGAQLDHVVTGQVLEKNPHPDSDHLWVTKVDVGMHNTNEEGQPEPLQIVCGAQNFQAGDHIVVSMVGATLPGGVKIKKSKLRGVESQGMNCSERELGLGDTHEGIMILPQDAPVGVPFAEWYGLTDSIIECELTPNRPDCMSMVGMAREVGAILDEDVQVEYPAVQTESGPDASELVEVRIDDDSLCQRYVGRVVRNVKIAPSPEWLAKRVTALGARPINNVVDVTNYVMFLTGQPLHAFDLGKLSEREGKRHIVVRAAKDGEKITTLDEVERTLTSDMTLITDDGNRPVALAGVMGGLNSDIDESTVDVLLESARFDPGHTSRTSRSLDLISESSMRFERQVDVSKCAEVADIAAALFEQCCSAEVCPGVVDVYPVPAQDLSLELRPARVRDICGADIDVADMVHILERLGCKTDVSQDSTLIRVDVPSYRPDLVREIDLVEEVLRLWGMDRVEPTLPAAKNHAGGLTPAQVLMRTMDATLRGCGLNETTTYNFAAAGDLELLGMGEEGRGVPVRIINPLVSDQSEMRRTLLAGLLRSVAYNRDHGVGDVALYEIGRVFYGDAHKSQPEEPSYIAGVLSGNSIASSWAQATRPVDFYDAKFVVEELARVLKIEKLRFRAPEPEKYGWLHPGRSAEVLAGKGELIGWVGDIHPKTLAAFDVDAGVVAFELSCDALLRLAQDQLPYHDIPTLPGVDIDLALVVDEDVSYETLMQRIASAGGKLLESVRLFDVYRDDERVGVGKKSMAFALTYRAEDRTLTSEEVDKAHEKLVRKVCSATGAEVRG